MENMNVVVSVNDGFLFPLKVMLFSLSENTERFLEVYLLYHDLSKKGRSSLERFVEEKCHGCVHAILMDGKLFREHDAARSMFSTETFYRLMIPYVLPENVERALWIDGDVIFKGNPEDFYDTKAQEQPAALVAAWNDRDRKKLWEYKERLGEDLKTESYFNAGVLLFFPEVIRQRLSAGEIVEFWKRNQKKLLYLEQDILNCLLGPETILKDATIYNNQAHSDEDAKEQLETARVIHYVSYRKPWKLYYEGAGDGYFWDCAIRAGYGVRSFAWHGLRGPTMLIYGLYKRIRYGEKIRFYKK